MHDPYLRIRIDVYKPEVDLIYSNNRHQPLDWIGGTRYDGYLTFESQDMLAELRRALKL